MSKSRILITGSNGLIGRSLVALFLSEGWEVFAHSRKGFATSATNVIKDLSLPEIGRAHV